MAVDTDADGTPNHVTHLAYAADGTCVGETLDGQATAFLVDHQNFTGASQVLEEKNAAGGVLRSYTLVVSSGRRTQTCLNSGRGRARQLATATGVE